MLFPEDDAPMLKAWIVKRLENTSDADADVLAEYVLALLRHDGSIGDVRKLCEEEIPDFLKEDSSVFVNDVFNAIQHKSYLPGALPLPKLSAPPTARPQALPFDEIPMISQGPPTGPSQNGSRKRSYNEQGDVDMQGANEFGARSFKQPRRGRGGRMQDPSSFRRGPAPGGFPGGGYQPSQLSAPQPGAPIFDPNNPMDALLKLQALGMPLPPMPDFAPHGPSALGGGQPARRRQRCRDYDIKGYCARGNTCMFEHGTDSIFVPPPMPLSQPQGNEEYDPSNASMLTGRFTGPGPQPQLAQPFGANGRGQAGHRGGRQGASKRARAPFSADGPVNDKSKSTIVVENIPEESFSEEEVRRFFSQFGNIVEVSMQPYKRLAIVKFDLWSAANAAWRSPKVVFDNRFVKVFWYKEDESTLPASKPLNKGGPAGAQNGTPNAGSPTPGPEIDMDEFLRKQEEAQKAHQEKVQKVQEIESKREELEKRQKELLAKQQEEKQKLYARLAASSKKSAGPSGQDGSDAKTQKPTGQSDALRAQLAALEAEAKQLGLDPDAMDDGSTWTPGGGRGRGRGGFPRARGFAPRGSRGGFRGRGGNHAAYAAYSLDNRPRKVSVTGVDFTVPEKDEPLRQYLFGIGEFTDIQTAPEATQVTFKDRKTAEKFFYSITNKEIPGVEGKVELSWVSGSASASTPSPSVVNGRASVEEQKQPARNEDTVMSAGGNSADKEDTAVMEHPPEQSDMDYDVADDSQWDIG